jgi:hypothetical protein
VSQGGSGKPTSQGYGPHKDALNGQSGQCFNEFLRMSLTYRNNLLLFVNII